MTPSRYLFSSLFGYSTLSCGPTAHAARLTFLLAALRRHLHLA
ncbi:hypothetical protein ACFQDE_01765 [Deinococcus caeni]